MCTSIVYNGKKSFAAFNFDNPGYKYQIQKSPKGVAIAIWVNNSFWMPVMGGNNRGDFITVPTMNPNRPESQGNGNDNKHYIDRDNLALFNEEITLKMQLSLVKCTPIWNEPGNSLMAQNSDKDGNVLQIYPSLGYKYFKKPHHQVLTNFQQMLPETTRHPWAGVDRYEKANDILSKATDSFDVNDMFALLKEVSQNGGAPTDVSLVYDLTKHIMYWCEKQNWDTISYQVL